MILVAFDNYIQHIISKNLKQKLQKGGVSFLQVTVGAYIVLRGGAGLCT